MIEVTWRDGKKDYIKVEDCPNCDYWCFKANAFMDIGDAWRRKFGVSFTVNIILAIVIIAILSNK